jgi:hypothetical protein
VNVRWRELASLSIAELLALSLWFSASAVLRALVREWPPQITVARSVAPDH